MSEALHKLTAYMRGLQGTKAGQVRDKALNGLGRAFSAAYAADRRLSRRPKPHPLFQIIAAQTGDPYEQWPLDDLKALRAESEELLDFLPRQVRGHVVSHIVGVDSISVLEVASDSVQSDSCVVYFHGGGFVMGSADSVLPEADVIAQSLGRTVYVVDYPLAPESHLDTQTRAASDVLQWIVERYPRFALIGESAGGYLGLYALLHDLKLNAACERVVLFYPFLDLNVNSEAIRRLASGYLLSVRILQWFVDRATGDTDVKEWRLQQCTSELHPSILVIVGEFDPLLDDWRAISHCAPRLEVRVAPGLMHGFMQMRGILPERNIWLGEAARFLRQGD